MKILTVAEMKAAEARADAAGHSYSDMMERAGRGAAETLLARLEDVVDRPVVILAGSGNNGGDGLVCAHYLRNAGVSVAVYATRAPDPDDSNVRRLKERGLLVADADHDPDLRVLNRLLAQAGIVVDALVGTGARLPLGGGPARILTALRDRLQTATERPVIVAVDCPSGVDCDTGACDPLLVRADITVTFGAYKRGLLAFPAFNEVGELVVADIGLEPHLPPNAPDRMDAAMAQQALPVRPRDAHKGTFGRALVIAGSRPYTGAAALAAEAAYRAGAGLVELAPPADLWPTLSVMVPEAIGLPLPEEAGALAPGGAAAARDSLSKASAVLLGCGLGGHRQTGEAVAEWVRSFAVHDPLKGRVTVDADGLRHLAIIPNWATQLPAGAVLTPHPGEFSALTGLATGEIQSDRVGHAQRAAQTWGHVVLLKGAFTVIAAPDGATTILPFANPALARAGTGDVLSGLIVGLLAQGLPAYVAARTAGWLHGRAAELAVHRFGTATSVVARDVLSQVPAALAELMR